MYKSPYNMILKEVTKKAAFMPFRQGSYTFVQDWWGKNSLGSGWQITKKKQGLYTETSQS